MLESLLVMPVQRLCRYQLILAEILKTVSGKARWSRASGMEFIYVAGAHAPAWFFCRATNLLKQALAAVKDLSAHCNTMVHDRQLEKLHEDFPQLVWCEYHKCELSVKYLNAWWFQHPHGYIFEKIK